MESYLVVIMHLKMVLLVMLRFGRNGHHSPKFTSGQWRVAISCLPSNKIVDYSVEHAMVIEVYVSTQQHNWWSNLRTYSIWICGISAWTWTFAILSTNSWLIVISIFAFLLTTDWFVQRKANIDILCNLQMMDLSTVVQCITFF